MSKSDPNAPKRLALIASKGTLDWAYPPFILASAAGAMGWEVGIFFTFYGLTLLKPQLTASVSPLGNPAMPMKMPFGPEGFQNINWPMPNILMANVPGFESVATTLMKQTFHNKGVATVEELRDMCVEMDVRLIGCQMTMDVFGFKKEDFIKEAEIGGAATFLEYAADADVQLFILRDGHMATLSIDTDSTQSVSVMKVKGRVDSDTAPEFEHALLQLLDDNRSKIVLNLQAVEFLSSAGLRAMVKTLKRAQSSGGDLHLASISQPIQGILLTVGMNQMFKIFSTSEEAAVAF